MRLKGVTVLFALVVTGALSARMRISLGYGMQLNAMLNSTLGDNMKKQVLNSGAVPLVGQSAGTDYRSTWSATTDASITPYALVSLPELRISSDWVAGTATWGFFTALTGIVPQTSAYSTGAYQLKEATTCAGVQYATCPLAAVNFVGASGTATYDSEIRTNLRFYALTGGMTMSRPLGNRWQGDLTLVTEFGVNVQTFAARTEFAANRCTTGSSIPCAQIADVRTVQGELKSESVYAFGPTLGATLRYERPLERWYLEAGASAIFLFMRIQNTGYTNFVGGSSVAFTQSSATLGVEPVQNIFAVLPSITLRCGIKL